MHRRFMIALFGVTMLAGGCQQGKHKTDGDPPPEHKATEPGAPGAANAPKPATAANPALEARSIELLQQMADIFAANARNCDKLAIDLQAFITENRPTLVQVSAMMKQQSAPDQRAFQIRFKAAQEAIGTKMHPGLVACSQNTGVQAALRDFPSS
jgi:hypothetical protein